MSNIAKILKWEELQDIDDPTYSFYIDCFDRSHHQIYHLHLMGLRVEKQKYKKDSDKAFKNIKETIFERLQNQNNKFNLSIIENKSNDEFITITMILMRLYKT